VHGDRGCGGALDGEPGRLECLADDVHHSRFARAGHADDGVDAVAAAHGPVVDGELLGGQGESVLVFVSGQGGIGGGLVDHRPAGGVSGTGGGQDLLLGYDDVGAGVALGVGHVCRDAGRQVHGAAVRQDGGD